jgi:ABC-2 type transport system permease protein
MIQNEIQAIYVMWLRQIKRFFRFKSRLVAMLVQPLFFLFILGSGFGGVQFPGLNDISFIHYFAPGIITMAILFSSMFTGISVLWDKQFGFLQEVLVAPISRLSIIVGRTLGGASIALIQGFIILLIAVFLGTPISSTGGLLLAIVFMILIAIAAVGFGLILASKMSDFQSFPLIMNLVIMPLLFLSSAFFPVVEKPTLRMIASIDPLFYMVDGLRGSLIGTAYIHPPLINLIIVLCICLVMLGLGSYLFSKSEI